MCVGGPIVEFDTIKTRLGKGDDVKMRLGIPDNC